MKNIKSSNIENIDFSDIKDIRARVEYYIMAWKLNKTIASLWDVENSQQSLEKITEFINKSPKYSKFFPEDQWILYKILLKAFVNNRAIWDEIEMFYKQQSSKIARYRISTWLALQEVAHDDYIPETSDDEQSNYSALKKSA